MLFLSMLGIFVFFSQLFPSILKNNMQTYSLLAKGRRKKASINYTIFIKTRRTHKEYIRKIQLNYFQFNLAISANIDLVCDFCDFCYFKLMEVRIESHTKASIEVGDKI